MEFHIEKMFDNMCVTELRFETSETIPRLLANTPFLEIKPEHFNKDQIIFMEDCVNNNKKIGKYNLVKCRELYKSPMIYAKFQLVVLMSE